MRSTPAARRTPTRRLPEAREADVHDDHHVSPLPRGAKIVVAATILATIAFVATFRLTGGDPSVAPPAAEVSAREFRFDDRPDGSIAVLDGRSGAQLDTLAPGTHGFLRGALRALVHERRGAGIGADTPFRLVRYADGRTALEDPTVSRRLWLDAFGPTNAATFSRLLSLPAPVAHRETR